MLILQYFTKQMFLLTLIFNILVFRIIGRTLPVAINLPYSEPSELRGQQSQSSDITPRNEPDTNKYGSQGNSKNQEHNEDYLIIFHGLNKTKETNKCLFNTRILKCVQDITEDLTPISSDKATTRSKRYSRIYSTEENKKRYFFENSPYNNDGYVPQPQLAPKHLVDEIQYYVKYAGASYCKMFSTNDTECSYCRDFDKESVILPIENKTTGMHAIMVALPLRREIVIAYRGSDKTYKLIDSMSKESIEFPGVKKTKVHKYFYDSAISLQKEIAKNLEHLLSLYPDSKIVLTGHSLGGGLATLAAPLIHRDLFIPYSRFRVITYGQLRIGNAEFANWYNELDINFTRVVNQYDEAAATPGFSVDWVHVKQEVHIVDEQYFVCETTLLEHPRCSFKKTWFKGLFTDHESVGNIGLSPRYCKNSFYFFKVKFFDY